LNPKFTSESSTRLKNDELEVIAQSAAQYIKDISELKAEVAPLRNKIILQDA